MMAELTVIGCRAGSPGTCGPASGYLLKVEGKTLLIDCGPGVVASLARDDRIAEIDGVLVSHPHADHCADLIALAYHRSFPRRLPPIPLAGPPDLAAILEQMDHTFGIPSLTELKAPIATTMPFERLRPGAEQEVLGIRVATLLMQHPVQTLAMRFPSIGFTYTADGALSDDLVEFATDSELLLAEATYLNADGRDLEGHGHMTAEGAGNLARRSNAQHLMVTHFADCAEREAIREQAEMTLERPVVAAAPARTLQLS